MEWINIKDRLPEVNKAIIVSSIYYNIKIMWFYKEEDEYYWTDDDGEYNLDYVHYWLPLPELPPISNWEI